MKSSAFAFLVQGAALVAVAALYLSLKLGAPPTPAVATGPAVGGGVGDASQMIEITVKGSYTQATARAKAGAPLTLRFKFKSNGTLDCSSQVRIPILGWSQDLATTGEAIAQISSQKAGTTLSSVCSMGMNNIKITFE